MADDVQIIDHDDPGQEIAVREPPGTLFRTDDPGEVVARATATANSLMDAVRAHDAKQTDKNKRLVSVIQGRDYPKVECWTLLGTMLGVFPVCVWTRKVLESGEGSMSIGWEARVEARTISGSVVGAAEAECLRTESTWRNRDDYAIRSMAQTRATSKALRIPLGFVMTLAGLEATPAEEIPAEPATRTTVPAQDTPAQDAEPKLATKQQTQRIAIKRNKLYAAGLTEEQYRKAMKDRYGVDSATLLTFEQANDLIGSLTEAGKTMGVET